MLEEMRAEIVRLRTETVALRWIQTDIPLSQRPIQALNRAQNWEEFRAAVRDWPIAGQNIIYADVDWIQRALNGGEGLGSERLARALKGAANRRLDLGVAAACLPNGGQLVRPGGTDGGRSVGDPPVGDRRGHEDRADRHRARSRHAAPDSFGVM